MGDEQGSRLPASVQLDNDLLGILSIARLFSKIPGNISDATSVFNLLEEMDFLETGRVKLVVDRGYYSKANINELYRRHYKFLNAARKPLKFVGKKLEKSGR